MDKMNYLWDTNIAIYYLQRQMPVDVKNFVESTLFESIPLISAITEIELLSWNSGNEKDLDEVKEFLNNFRIIELEHPIKLKTAEIRRQNRTKLPDAIIAATALCYGLTLITRNTSDFNKIPNISMVNPWL